MLGFEFDTPVDGSRTTIRGFPEYLVLSSTELKKSNPASPAETNAQ